MKPWAVAAPRLRWLVGEGGAAGERVVPEETAVAIVHDASTTAVMMASPHDLEDFAVGFSLSEGIIERTDDITAMEVVETEHGIEVRCWLGGEQAGRLSARRRRMAGPTGCGLCGIDSLIEAVRPPSVVRADVTVQPEALLQAMDDLGAAQRLGRETRAVHAAGFWTPEDGLVAAREDVGRHNALDKLIGGLVRGDVVGRAGVVLLTSRVSVEMVQKAAVLGAPVICAVSAPTALAVRTAEAAGMTLIAVARSDGFEVFTHPRRVRFP